MADNSKDAKEVIRNLIANKVSKYNGKKKTYIRTNNDLPITTQTNKN